VSCQPVGCHLNEVLLDGGLEQPAGPHHEVLRQLQVRRHLIEHNTSTNKTKAPSTIFTTCHHHGRLCIIVAAVGWGGICLTC
jgi:hypothetical protein